MLKKNSFRFQTQMAAVCSFVFILSACEITILDGDFHNVDIDDVKPDSDGIIDVNDTVSVADSDSIGAEDTDTLTQTDTSFGIDETDTSFETDTTDTGGDGDTLCPSGEEEQSFLTAVVSPGEEWVERCKNPYRIQGCWFTSGSNNNQIEKKMENAPGGMFCASGKQSAVSSIDENRGAALVFNLCQAEPYRITSNEVYTIEKCPWQIPAIHGIKMIIAGDIGGSELRVEFREYHPINPPYIKVEPNGKEVTLDISDANPELLSSKLESIAFRVVPLVTEATSYQFCVSNISFY